MQAILNLQFRLWINNIPVLVRVGDGGTVRRMRETQAFGRGGKQTGFETRDRLVDEVVDRVDHVVNEGLAVGQRLWPCHERGCG